MNMEEQKKKRRRSLWWRVVRASLLTMVALLLLLFTGAAVLLTPKRITPIAARLMDGLFIADVHFDTLKVSLFQEFPYINLIIKNGQVRSRAFDMLPPLLQGALPSDCDSLLRFEELSVSLHLPKLLQSQIDIRRVRLSRAELNAYISPYGIANWDIYLPDTTMVSEKEMEAFRANIQRFIIRDGFRFRYRSDPDSLSASLQGNRLFIRGDLSVQWEEIKLETFVASGLQIEAQAENKEMIFTSTIDSLRLSALREERYTLFMQSKNNLRIDREHYAKALPVALSGEVGFSLSRLDSLFFSDFSVSVANTPLVLDGNLVFANPFPRAQLECRIDSLSVAGILNLIPTSLLPKEMEEIETDIEIKIHALVDYPAYTITVRTLGGQLNYPTANAYIHTLALDASYTYCPDRLELSGLELRQCNIEASGISLHAKGYVQNLMGDPDIDLSIQGNIRLDTLSRILSLSDNITARGAITIDAATKFLWSDFLRGDLSTATLRGRVEAERLLFRIPKDSILLMARGGYLSFGANQNQRDSLIEKGAQILRLSFRADSANIRYKEQFRLTMGNTRLSARSAASALDGDTTQIHPFTGAFETKYLLLRTADSTQIALEEGACTFSLLPTQHDHSIPVVTTQLKAHLFQMSDAENRYQLLSPEIALQATRVTPRRTSVGQETGEHGMRNDSISASNRSSRRPERVVDDFASGNLDFELDSDAKRLFRQWEFEGAIQAEGGALHTPYFPLPVTLGDTNLEISPQELRLMQTKIQAGRSQIECTGKVSNLRQLLLGRGNLGVSGFIRSDTLDINELAQAANAGLHYAESGVEITDLEEINHLIIIPANLTLDLKLFSEHTRYGGEYLTNLSGSLTSLNRTLQINDLEASSSFGAFKFSALYATRSKNDIKVGFDLDMKKVEIERLIALIPSIDTLAPMLRSFEGVVDCQISATAEMDTEMNLLLPTLSAACRIRGENMVLLDGETFSEISKMLYFKNKSRNLIDHISVDFLIRNNLIEIFPFILEIDRYRTAVSGIHNFDMSFNYHISVLRSPIPFKLGIDVTGTLDNPRYRIVRCRYRDTNIPSYVALIDATRIELLQAIKTFDPSAAFRSTDRSAFRYSTTISSSSITDGLP